MKALLVSTLAAGFMASTALAGPVELTEAQLDQVAAGSYDDSHDYDHGRHDGHGKGYDKYKKYGGHYYYPYYYNKNYNDNDNNNDNYNYNENHNYIYISIPFFGYGDYGKHGGYGNDHGNGKY